MNNNDPLRFRVYALLLALSLCALMFALLRSIGPISPDIRPTPTATITPEATETPTASVTPTVYITNTPMPTATLTATLGSTSSPTPSPTPTATAIPYRTVVMLRHDAMESVFYWFPERRDPRADAFIATYGCDNIGRWFWLRLPDGFSYHVVVTDCMQEKHRAAHRAKWGDVEVIELDGDFWRARGLSMTGGVMGKIAEADGPFP